MPRAERGAPPSKGRRVLRIAAGVAMALALAHGVTVWQAGRREVRLTYVAPAGPLSVHVLDDEGDLVRRVSFGAGAERAHALVLPEGDYQARLTLPERLPVERRFAVRGDAAIRLAW